MTFIHSSLHRNSFRNFLFAFFSTDKAARFWVCSPPRSGCSISVYRRHMPISSYSTHTQAAVMRNTALIQCALFSAVKTLCLL